jgi:2-amino-4-hydroxy-6-hydroxymethyldihydropteridine diphosphokinase
VRAYIGLGANLGDTQATLRAALRRLGAARGVRLAGVAPFIRTAPVGPPGQPAYLNTVCRVETTLRPRALLDLCHRIERTLGRRREEEVRWGPRPVDLDLLLYGTRILREPGLVVPHPEMHRRLFVLEPLAAIAPDAVIPGQGRVRDCLAALDR